MYRVWSLLKVLVVVGLLAGVGWIVYKKANEAPPTARDVRAVAYAVSRIVGRDKTELTQTDKPSVEFQVDKVKRADLATVREGLLLLGDEATREEFVAAELILLRVYATKPEGYVSRIDGDPWDVSGEITQMGVFEIDRTEGEQDSVSEMVAAFGASVTPREPWATNKG